ncbi:MAG: hypothetical protein Q4F95_08900 [Oscillospiraceae bacterium]|nr:hypothetical protein [Oscillospiraceae bacterium]
MNKILTEIYLPANGKSYEVYLPENMYAGDAAQLLADLFTEAAGGFYCRDDVNILCDRFEGRAFDSDKTLKELNVKNHSMLMLV